MISERSFADVRIAATLNHTFPGLSTHLSDGDRLIVEVLWPPARPHRGKDVTVVHPCAFRQHVAHAWARHLGGEEMRFLDLDGDPLVAMRAIAGGESWPSGMVRVPLANQYVYAFGTTLDPDACAALGSEIIEGFDQPDHVLGVGIQGDADTQISTIYAETTDRASPAAHHAVVDVLEQLIARYATTQLLDGLPSTTGQGEGRI